MRRVASLTFKEIKKYQNYIEIPYNSCAIFHVEELLKIDKLDLILKNIYNPNIKHFGLIFPLKMFDSNYMNLIICQIIEKNSKYYIHGRNAIVFTI